MAWTITRDTDLAEGVASQVFELEDKDQRAHVAIRRKDAGTNKSLASVESSPSGIEEEYSTVPDLGPEIAAGINTVITFPIKGGRFYRIRMSEVGTPGDTQLHDIIVAKLTA
jgi:hypothetical protein